MTNEGGRFSGPHRFDKNEPPEGGSSLSSETPWKGVRYGEEDAMTDVITDNHPLV